MKLSDIYRTHFPDDYSSTWKSLSARHGIAVREDVDLTSEALPFWSKGWKLGHLLLKYAAPLVRRYLGKGGDAAETFASMVSVCMTAYAMALGSAKYGVLVLEKM